MDAHARQITELEAALQSCRDKYDRLLDESRFQINALEKQARYLREHIALLERAAAAPPPSPPCG